MKKIIITLFTILIIGESYALFHFLNSNKKTNKDIIEMKNEIKAIEEENTNNEKEKELLIKERDNEKVKYEKYIKEYEIWTKMKEKIQSAS